MKKFNWKAATPALLTAGSWLAIAVMWGFGVSMTFYSLIAPVVAQILGITLGIVWTPPSPTAPT